MTDHDIEHTPLIPDEKKTPSLQETLLVYFFSGLLLILLGAWFQHLHLLLGLVITEFAFIAGPALLYTLLMRYDLSQTFHITPIRLRTVVITIITTGAAFVLAGVVAAFQEMFLPVSEGYQEIWQTVLEEFHQLPLLVTLLLVSIVPGVCEEFLFRGFLLHGMRQRCSDTCAILVAGFLFGAFHLDPYRFLPVSLLGVLFGYMVVKTDSLFTGIVAHCTNNAIAISLAYFALTAQENGLIDMQQRPRDLPLFETIVAMIGLLVMTSIALSVFLTGLRALPQNTSRNGLDGRG